jgi:hypothetical protein
MLFEWRIRDIESGVCECKRRLYEVDSLRETLRAVDYSISELRTELTNVKEELGRQIENNRQLEEFIRTVQQPT